MTFQEQVKELYLAENCLVKPVEDNQSNGDARLSTAGGILSFFDFFKFNCLLGN